MTSAEPAFRSPQGLGGPGLSHCPSDLQETPKPLKGRDGRMTWRHSPSAASPRPTVCGTQLVGGRAQGSAAPALSHSWGTCTHPAGGYEKQELRGPQASLLPPPSGAHPSLGGGGYICNTYLCFCSIQNV